MKKNIVISAEGLDVTSSINWVMSPEAGGIDVFIGTVRNATKEKTVMKLEFECYEKMALLEIEKIVNAAFLKWPLIKVLVHHRIGNLVVGEVPVIIAVSAKHRDAAFESCRYIIDSLKQTVPIWKKEYFEDGAVWVAAHP